MEMKTQLSLHDRVVTIISGRIVSLEINGIILRVAPVNGRDGGEIEYSGWRRDRAVGMNAPFEVRNVKFNESDLGKTFWRSKEDMLAHLSGLDVEPDYYK